MVSQLPQTLESSTIEYPDSDGKPMADNTKQFRWIVTIKENLDLLFADNPNVFVAGDLLWYPVEGNNKIRVAPDAMVAFGRPKGDRGSYQQWKEDHIAPQVVFEVLSPGNSRTEMARKLLFYDRYGVEEYYIYDPDNITLEGWQRGEAGLEEIPQLEGWISPLLKIRFELDSAELNIFHPDGNLFETFQQIQDRAEQAQARAETAEARAETAETRAETAETRAAALAAKLKELGIDPEQIG